MLSNYDQQVLVPLKTECQYKYPKIEITHPFSLTFPSNFFSFDFCVFISFFAIVFRLTIWTIFHVAFFRIFRNRHWELFYITAIWPDITKIVVYIYIYIYIYITYIYMYMYVYVYIIYIYMYIYIYIYVYIYIYMYIYICIYTYTILVTKNLVPKNCQTTPHWMHPSRAAKTTRMIDLIDDIRFPSKTIKDINTHQINSWKISLNLISNCEFNIQLWICVVIATCRMLLGHLRLDFHHLLHILHFVFGHLLTHQINIK